MTVSLMGKLSFTGSHPLVKYFMGHSQPVLNGEECFIFNKFFFSFLAKGFDECLEIILASLFKGL